MRNVLIGLVTALVVLQAPSATAATPAISASVATLTGPGVRDDESGNYRYEVSAITVGSSPLVGTIRGTYWLIIGYSAGHRLDLTLNDGLGSTITAGLHDWCRTSNQYGCIELEGLVGPVTGGTGRWTSLVGRLLWFDLTTDPMLLPVGGVETPAALVGSLSVPG